MLPERAYDGRVPLPHWLTRVNLLVTNRLTAPIVPWLPGFCLLEHVGRRTGRIRHSPMNVFRRAPGAWIVGIMLSLMGVTEYLEMRRAA